MAPHRASPCPLAVEPFRTFPTTLGSDVRERPRRSRPSRCRRGGPHPGRRLDDAWGRTSGHRRPRLVPRPDQRPARAGREVCVSDRPPRRGGHRQRQGGLGDLSPPAPDGAGQRLVADSGRRLRRCRRQAAAVLVAGKPLPLRRQLDQRHRARCAADQLGVDPPPARRVAQGRRPLRRATRRPCARSGGTRSTLPPSAAAAPRPTTTSSPRPLDSFVAACAFPWYAESAQWRDEPPGLLAARAGGQHLRVRAEPRAGHRVPLLRHRARRSRRPPRATRSGTPLSPSTWALLCCIPGRSSGHPRRIRPSRPGKATPTRDVGWSSTTRHSIRWDGAARHRCGDRRSRGHWWPPSGTTVCSVALASLCLPHAQPRQPTADADPARSPMRA